MRSLLCLAALVTCLTAVQAWAMDETILDIRVQNAVRTDEETVVSISGLSIGQRMQPDTLDIVRERLHSAGLFADVNVYWEPYQHGVRVNIVVKEKFPWAPLPTFSYSSPNNYSGGVIIAHGNLFGRGKRGVIGGRYSNVDSGALVAYDDPAVWGSWMFFTVKAKYQSQIIPEYSNQPDMPLLPMRDTKLRSYGGDISVGVAWFRKVRTSVGWILDWNKVIWSNPNLDNSYALPLDLPPAADSARRGAATANLTFDFRAREHAVVYGNALGFSLELGSTRWGSDGKLTTGRPVWGLNRGFASFAATTSSCAREPSRATICRCGRRILPADPTCAGISIGSFRVTPTCAPRSSTTFPFSRCGASTCAD